MDVIFESNPGRDLFVRPGYEAPRLRSLVDFASDPVQLRKTMYSDSWSCWLALNCEDGRWSLPSAAVINSRNGIGTDKPGPVGGPSLLARILRDVGEVGLSVTTESIKTGHKKHKVNSIQLIRHPLCGETQAEITARVKGAGKVYDQPSKGDLQLWLMVHWQELLLHRAHLDIVRDWIFRTFDFVIAVEYLSAVKYRLNPLHDFEQTLCDAISGMRAKGNWNYEMESELVTRS